MLSLHGTRPTVDAAFVNPGGSGYLADPSHINVPSPPRDAALSACLNLASSCWKFDN